MTEPRNLTFCKDDIINYVESGEYYSECNTRITIAKDELNKKLKESKVSVTIDIDDTAIELYGYWKLKDFAGTDETITQSFFLENEPALQPVFDFYTYCITNNVNVFFLTGRREEYRSWTKKLLNKAGYIDYYSLLMKPTNDNRNDAQFKTDTIKSLQNQGYVIAVNIDDQESEMNNTADYQCPIPNPMYNVAAYEKRNKRVLTCLVNF
jgi:predicted secreted acid phosphatase